MLSNTRQTIEIQMNYRILFGNINDERKKAHLYTLGFLLHITSSRLFNNATQTQRIPYQTSQHEYIIYSQKVKKKYLFPKIYWLYYYNLLVVEI